MSLPPILLLFASVLVWILGVGLYFGIPFLLPKDGSWRLRYTVFKAYSWLFQKSLGRGQIVNREHAGVELCASKYDSDHGAEQIKLDGEWNDFEDTAERMRYLRNGDAFGLIDEAATLVIDPIDCAIGAARRRFVENGQQIMTFDEVGDCVREHAVIPETAPVSNLRDAKYLLGGNADPTDAAATEEFEKKAWFDHQNVPVVDAMVMAGLFAATMFVIWLAFSFAADKGTGTSAGGSIISGMLPLFFWRWSE